MKRFLSFILSLILIVSLVPAFASADSYSTVDATMGSSVTVKLSGASDHKTYMVKAPSAGRLTVKVSTTSKDKDYAIKTTLKDADGRVVVDSQNGTAYSMPSYGASEGDVFYLFVEDFYRGYDTSFKITFEFSTTENWETENNDTSEKADKISSGTTYRGSISKSDDTDFYKFTVSSAKKVKLTFGPDVIDNKERMWDVDLYSADGESFDLFNTGSKNSRTVTLKKGTYYVRIVDETTTAEDGTPTTAVGGDYNLSFVTSAVKVKRPSVTAVKMYGKESWLYDNYATATVSVKNGGSIDGYTLRISKSSNMKSGTKKKNYAISASNGVTAKKIKSKIRMGIYPAYYVQVRGYVKDAFGNKIYGKYSRVKSGSLSARDYNDLK